MEDHPSIEQELRVVKRVNHAISLAPDVEAVASSILDIIIEETKAENASLMMPSKDMSRLEIHAAKGKIDDYSRYSENAIGQVFNIGEGIAGMVGLSKEPIIIEDTRHDPHFQARDVKVKIASLLAVPLVYGRNELVGILNLSHSRPNMFSEKDLKLVKFFVAPAALALRNARMMNDIESINRILREDLSMTDKAMEELRKNALKLFNYLSIGILAVDSSGIITAINKKAIDLIGMKAGQSIYAILREDTIKRLVLEETNHSTDISLHGRVLNLECTPIPFRPSWHTLISVRDITAERFREEKLLKIRDQYKDLVENAIDAVYIIRDGRFILTNRRFQDIFGYSSDELFGLHFRHLVTLNSLKLISKSLRKYRDRDLFIPNLEIEARKKNKDTLFVEASIGRLMVEGKPAFVGVIRDITVKKQLLNIKTRFLHVASHEIRTPLTVIRGYAKMLMKQEYGTLTDDQKEWVKEIKEHSDKLLLFTNTLLDFARINSGKLKIRKQPTNILDLLGHMTKTLQIHANEKGVSLVLEADTDLPELNIDPLKIEEAITNLVDNAIKHSPKNSTVRIYLNRIGKTTDTDYIHRLLGQESISIRVVDQGPGIKPEEAKEIFSEFYVGGRGSNKLGIGLGLAITKEIIHAHGGKVWAEPSSKGGHFVMTIPLNTQAT